MRIFWLSALALLLAACGAYSFPESSPSTPASGTVSGRVIAVPCAPVQPAPNSCAGRPVGGIQIIYQSGSATASTTTDATGNYSIQLAPGTWKVRLATYMRLISGPTLVTVSEGSSLVANYLLDSGIRAPAPQA